MSNSALSIYIDRTNGNYAARTSLISKIMIHNAFASGDRYTMAELINGGTSGFHYGISTDGVVGLFTDEMRAANGCSDTTVNNICIHILCMSSESDVNDVSGITYEMLVKLVEDICRRNFIRFLASNPLDKENANLLQHRWIDSNTNCPGKLANRLGDLVSTVNNALKTAKIASDSEALKAQSTISVGGTYPYLATIGPSVGSIDYDSLRTMGTVGVMFFAGSYFDESHHRRNKYINASLGSQTQSALKANMPFALYVDVRSRDESEARLECKELFYVISKYPPKLGLWLHLDTTAYGSILTSILAIYYNKIVQWGLKSKCGVYATRQQINKLDWAQWTDKYALWTIDPLPNLNCLENVLTPSLFKL